MKKLKKGDTVTYTRKFAFGKTGKETSKVIMVLNGKALLENGQEI